MGKRKSEPSKKGRNCFIYKCHHRTMVVLLICNQGMMVRIRLVALLNNIIVREFESLPVGSMADGKAWSGCSRWYLFSNKWVQNEILDQRRVPLSVRSRNCSFEFA